jgi:transposase
MFIRRNRNRSGSKSIQVISKEGGKYRVVKSFGSSCDAEKLKELEQKAKFFIAKEEKRNTKQVPLLSVEDPEDRIVRSFVETIHGTQITQVGPELVLGKIFDTLGLSSISEEMFRHLVLARLTYPVSKLKTTEYLLQHHGIDIDVDAIYRFLDRFHKVHKEKIEKIIYKHSKDVLGEIQMIFYDMTTLYFEAEDEDDLRKIGFSKDGKFQCPQIMLGLLVGENGYPIAYDLFEGNTFEGHTMIPIIEETQKKYNLPKPIVIADSGLLSKENIKNLEEQEYTFILGARIKNEADSVKKEILKKTKNMKDGATVRILKSNGNIIVISFSEKRAKKDAYNREKGIKRLEKKIAGGKLTKTSINNRGYNKFLKIEDEVKVSLDEEKMQSDKIWDGLKGYTTNSQHLSDDEIITNYNHLWKIERAFRISKSDLRIRPIFHRKRERIEAHLTIAFAAYAVYKELERQLNLKKIKISPAKAIELTKTIFQLSYTLPCSQENISHILKPSPDQKKILNIL